MPRRVCVLVAIVILAMVGARAEQDWQEAEVVPIAEGLAMPTNVAIAPDGTVWFAELAGNVSTIDQATGEMQQVRHLPDVATGGERGLAGMALAHDFQDTGAFYLYYTKDTDDGDVNHLVRVEEGTETTLVTVPGAEQHNGGRILVAPDGTLYVGTGENLLRDPAQNPDSLLGKILHMTPEGEPVEGNLQGVVYTLGHRNVFGLAMDDDGEIWATENSGWRRDEVNRIEAGGNYGYPECEGHGLNGVDDPCPTDKGYTFPVMTFYEDRAVAPTGATFWNGQFYWASLNEGAIHHIYKDSETQEWNDTVVLEHGTPILDLAVGPDNGFYFSTMEGVYRVYFGDDASDPVPTVSNNEPDHAADLDEETPAAFSAVALFLAAVVAARGRR